MKKIFLSLLLIVGLSSFAQDNLKPKNIDKGINVLLDSLSNVYNVKVGAVIVNDYPNLRTTTIVYVKNGELVKKIIKTEKNPPKRDILSKN
jgi:hypothetical protein